MRPKQIRTATGLALMWSAIAVAIPNAAQAQEVGWTCFPGADGGWDCRSSDDTAALPPRPPTPIDGRVPAQLAGPPSGDPLELYTAPIAGAAPGPRPPARPRPPRPTAAPTTTVGGFFFEPREQRGFLTRKQLDYVSPWAACGDQPYVATEQEPLEDAPIDITSDENEIYNETIAEFTGNVDFTQGYRVIKADFLRFNIPEEELELIGTTYMKDADMEVWGSYAKFDMGQDEGNIQKAGFNLPSRHARGSAEKIIFAEHGDLTILQGATYSTCPAIKEDWVIVSDTITLTPPEDIGVARDATLRFKGVPVMWTPYMSFPLSDARKSGFIRPKFGYDSEDGVDIADSYYWNIAPNQDATFGLRYIGSRGFQGQGQYRYLTEDHEGEAYAEYMPNDSEFDDYRAMASFQNRSSMLGNKLTADVNLNWASDDDYFRDLGDNLDTTSVQFLERRGDLTWHGENWDLRGRVQEFQTLDPDLADAGKPYKRLPQFLFETLYPWRWGRAEFDLYAEGVNWGHDVKTEGIRIDVEPAVSLPFYSLWGHVTPKVAARFTNYNLNGRLDGGPDSVNRFLPIASVDAGMTFERDFNWSGAGVTQTLEPRAFYLYIPETDQDDIPLFDTADRDFSFAQMFQNNRFSGTDRLGDANQMSLALTSRLLESASGRERLSASLGQIYYFSDREVTLNGGAPETDRSSEIVFAVDATPGRHWTFNFDYQYDPHLSLMTKTAVRVNYKRDWDHIVNLSFRKRRDNNQLLTVNQLGASTYWGFGQNWKAIGNVAWDFEEASLVEMLAGIHYDTCCWSAMLAYRQFVQEDSPDKRSKLLLLFELKGLGRYGQDLYDLMEEGILGFNAPEESPL